MVPPAPVRVSSQRPLAPSVTSVTAEMIPGSVHKSPAIYLTAEEPRKTSARRPSMKAVRPVTQVRSGSEKEGKCGVGISHLDVCRVTCGNASVKIKKTRGNYLFLNIVIGL